MKKSFLKPVVCAFFGLAVALFSSCSVYQPAITSVPLLKQKGEVMIEGAMAFPFFAAPSMNLTVSAAPFDHVSVQAFGDFTDENNAYAQGAVGLFFPSENRTVLELYVGGGYGMSGVRWDFSDVSRRDVGSYDVFPYADHGTYGTVFGQLNYGVRDLGPVDMGFGVKVGGLYPSLSIFDQDQHRYVLADTKTHLLVEPIFMFRVGGPKVKFSFEMGYTSISLRRPFSYARFSVSTGIQFRF